MLEAVSRSRGFFWIRPADAGGDAWSLHAILDRLANYAWLLGTVSSKCSSGKRSQVQMPCVVRSSQLCFYFIKLL